MSTTGRAVAPDFTADYEATLDGDEFDVVSSFAAEQGASPMVTEFTATRAD